jgi:epoxyqueuosine reductase
MKMRIRYRRFSWLSDWRGIKSALGELRGWGYPKQPKLEKASASAASELDEAWFVNAIQEKIASHPANQLEFPFGGEKVFDPPLVGFIAGDDPILEEYKRIIGPHHFTPAEMMAWQAANSGVSAPPASELGVVSFIMPIRAATRAENAARSDWTSERWAQTRLLGEIASQAMVRDLVTLLMGRGVLAVSPDVTPMFNKKRYPRVGWASPWSHRHMAYAAGLGTFGLHDFLITDAGAAHRCASFVVHRPLKPNRVRPADIHAACLHHQGKKCMKCAKRCPVGAITAEGHDKERCYQRVAQSIKYCNRNYHIFIYGCGLCAVGVPCEARDPADLSTDRPKPGDPDPP